MNINIDRPDIEIATRQLMTTILYPLTPEQKLKALQWIIEILEEMQNTVE